MSAFVSPVGGVAWTTLSILKISSRRRYLIRFPVNGERSGWCTCRLWVGVGEMTGFERGGGDAGAWWLVKTMARLAKAASAIAEPPAAISTRRVVRAEDL